MYTLSKLFCWHLVIRKAGRIWVRIPSWTVVYLRKTMEYEHSFWKGKLDGRKIPKLAGRVCWCQSAVPFNDFTCSSSSSSNRNLLNCFLLSATARPAAAAGGTATHRFFSLQSLLLVLRLHPNLQHSRGRRREKREKTKVTVSSFNLIQSEVPPFYTTFALQQQPQQ